jgi:hypothetical protein
MEGLAHLVAVPVRTLDVQLDQRPNFGQILQILSSHARPLVS